MIPMNNKTMSFPLGLQIQVMYPFATWSHFSCVNPKNQLQHRKNITKYIRMDNYRLLKYLVALMWTLNISNIMTHDNWQIAMISFIY